MRLKLSKLLLFVSLLALLASLALSFAAAQTSGTFDLSWSSVDGGGGSSSGGSYALSGTIGQSDAGHLSGGNFSLGGGFWPGQTGTVDSSHTVYLPFVIK